MGKDKTRTMISKPRATTSKRVPISRRVPKRYDHIESGLQIWGQRWFPQGVEVTSGVHEGEIALDGSYHESPGSASSSFLCLTPEQHRNTSAKSTSSNLPEVVRSPPPSSRKNRPEFLASLEFSPAHSSPYVGLHHSRNDVVSDRSTGSALSPSFSPQSIVPVFQTSPLSELTSIEGEAFNAPSSFTSALFNVDLLSSEWNSGVGEIFPEHRISNSRLRRSSVNDENNGSSNDGCLSPTTRTQVHHMESAEFRGESWSTSNTNIVVSPQSMNNLLSLPSSNSAVSMSQLPHAPDSLDRQQWELPTSSATASFRTDTVSPDWNYPSNEVETQVFTTLPYQGTGSNSWSPGIHRYSATPTPDCSLNRFKEIPLSVFEDFESPSLTHSGSMSQSDTHNRRADSYSTSPALFSSVVDYPVSDSAGAHGGYISQPSPITHQANVIGENNEYHTPVPHDRFPYSENAKSKMARGRPSRRFISRPNSSYRRPPAEYYTRASTPRYNVPATSPNSSAFIFENAEGFSPSDTFLQ